MPLALVLRTLVLLNAVLLLSASCCAPAVADETPSYPSSAPRPQRLLVLKTGRILAGGITQSAGGYIVENPNGRVLVAFEQVKFEAADLRDAYRKHRLTMPIRTASNHISLSRWCVSQQLHAEARHELRDALQLEPDRQDARRMLLRLVELKSPRRAETAVVSTMAPLAFDGLDKAPAKSLSGLSPESARLFVGKVQPILVNKCSNASCHGTAANSGLHLLPVRIGGRSHRIFAERNLAMMLKFIDIEKPDRSQLLIAPQGNHGRGGRAVFYGKQGTAQMELLRQWVSKIAGERLKTESAGKRQGGRETTPQQAISNVRLTSSAAAIGRRPLPRRADYDALPNTTLSRNSVGQTAATEKRTRFDTDDDLIDSIREDQLKDAFDPDAFNSGTRINKRR